MMNFVTAPQDMEMAPQPEAGAEHHADASDSQCTDATQQPVPEEYMDAMDKLRTYCMRRTQVDLTDAMAQFMDVPTAVLELMFSVLVEEEVLARTDKRDVFKVLAFSSSALQSQPSVGPVAIADNDLANMAGKLTKLAVTGTL
jgi:hypothetical protein